MSKAAACKGKSDNRPPGMSVACPQPMLARAGGQRADQPLLQNGQSLVEFLAQQCDIAPHLPHQVTADGLPAGATLDEQAIQILAAETVEPDGVLLLQRFGPWRHNQRQPALGGGKQVNQGIAGKGGGGNLGKSEAGGHERGKVGADGVYGLCQRLAGCAQLG